MTRDKEALDAPVGGVRSGTRWNSVGVGVAQLVRFLSNLALVRLLAPEDFGLMAIALVVIGFLEIFTDSGTGQAVIRRPELTDSFMRSVFTINVTIGAALTLAVMGLAEVAEAMFAAPGLAPILRPLSLTFVVTSAALVQRGLLMRKFAFKGVAIAEIVKAIVYGVVALVLAAYGEGVWALVYASLVSASLGTVLLWILSPWKPSLGLRREHVQEIWGFCVGMLGTTLTTYFLQNSDRAIISRFLGTEALGYYSIALRLVQFPLRVVTRVLISVLTPVFARLQDDHAAFGERFLRAGAGIAVVTVPAMVGLALVAEPLVVTLWGEEWLSVAPLLVLLAPMGIVRSLASATGPIYIALGHTQRMFWWGLVFNVATVIAFLIGAQVSIEGVAAAFGAVNLLLFYPYFAVPFRFIDLPVARFVRSLAPVLLAAGVMAAAVLPARFALSETLGPRGQLAVLSLLGAAVYVGVAVALKAPGVTDLAALVGYRRGGRAEDASGSPPA